LSQLPECFVEGKKKRRPCRDVRQSKRGKKKRGKSSERNYNIRSGEKEGVSLFNQTGKHDVIPSGFAGKEGCYWRRKERPESLHVFQRQEKGKLFVLGGPLPDPAKGEEIKSLPVRRGGERGGATYMLNRTTKSSSTT